MMMCLLGSKNWVYSLLGQKQVTGFVEVKCKCYELLM